MLRLNFNRCLLFNILISFAVDLFYILFLSLDPRSELFRFFLESLDLSLEPANFLEVFVGHLIANLLHLEVSLLDELRFHGI